MGMPTTSQAARSITSHMAQAAIEPRRQSTAALVFLAIGDSPDGLTCAEVEDALGLKHQTASPRVHELAHARCIAKAGTIRNGSEVYVVIPGATMALYSTWQRATKTSRKAAEVATIRSSDDQRVIDSARKYAEAYWTNRPPQELDAARNTLLDVARHVNEP